MGVAYSPAAHDIQRVNYKPQPWVKVGCNSCEYLRSERCAFNNDIEQTIENGVVECANILNPTPKHGYRVEHYNHGNV